MSNGLVKLDISNGIARFDVGEQNDKRRPEKKKCNEQEEEKEVEKSKEK